MTDVSPGDDYARRDILSQEGPRESQMILIDAKSDFSGGLILGKKALTPSVFELLDVVVVLIHQQRQRSYFRL